MDTARKPTIESFRSVLGDNAIRPLQIIHLALGAGVTVFAIVVLVLNAVVEFPASDATSYLGTLTIVNLVLTVLLFTFALRFHDYRLSRASLENRVGSGALTVERCFDEIRTAHIIRLALLEAAAMFGIVICLLAVVQGAMPVSEFYLINLIGVVLFLLFISGTFPTQDRILHTFEQKFLV
jgi:hypothetical protein